MHLTEQKEFVAKSIPQKTAKFLPHRPRRGRPLRTRTKTCLRLPLRPVPGVCLARPDRAPPPRPPFLTVPAAAACAPLVQGRLRHPGDPVVAACAQPRLLSPPPQRAFRTGRRSWGNSEQKDPKTAAVGKIDEEEALFSEEVASGDCGGGGGGSDARQRPLMAVLRRRRRQRTPCVALSHALLFAECTLHRGVYVMAHTRPGGVCTVQYTANEDRGREGLSIGHTHTERGRLLLHAISPPWGTHPRGLLLSIRGFLRRVCLSLRRRRSEAAAREKRYLRPRRESRSEGGGGMARTRATFAHTSLAHLHTRQAGREAAERRLM